MKKLAALFFFIFLLNVPLTAVEYSGGENVAINVGVSFVYPLVDEWSVAGNVLGGILFSSLYAGMGYHFNIIPNILVPGAYFEINFWLLPIVIQYLLSSDDEIEELDILDFGLRAYNRFRLGRADFEPFLGFNVSMIHGFSTTAGFLLAFNNFGIELCRMRMYPDHSGRFLTGSADKYRMALVYRLR